MADKAQLYGSHPESPTAVLCSCAPKLAALDDRIAKLEAIVHKEHTPTLNEHDDRLDRVEVDVKALRGDIADVKSMQAEALGYLRKFDRALDLGVIDPDPTPNMRGPR